MSSKSSFLPRAFARQEESGLPFHNHPSQPIRKQPSEYDLSDLSPRPDDTLLPAKPSLRDRTSPHRPRNSSPSVRYNDAASASGSDSKMKPPALFPGPPPPIATSTLFYRDEEDRGIGRGPTGPRPTNSSFTRNALSSVSSVLFDRGAPSHAQNDRQSFEPDTIWRGLQRREKALQTEIQHLLDAQSAGLAAHLDPNVPSSPSTLSGVSNTGESSTGGRIRLEIPASTADGGVVPVRQPRRRPLGLRSARAGLSRGMTLLANLKAEEDASLTAAVGARKSSLAQLRRLASRRDGIAAELQVLEGDGSEPLARELRELSEEKVDVAAEIAELEERLVGLRSREKWLRGKIEDVRNKREAGLSGYKGALKEVDAKVSGLLKRPPVRPLDLEAIGGLAGSQDRTNVDGASADEQTPGGVEFLRMRPERRTVEMASDWWESEIAILEKRKGEVDEERNALVEGAQVWKEAVQLVSDFETGLRKEMRDGPDDGDDKGKQKIPTPEEAMRAQLGKMAEVIAGLDQRLQTVEEKGWNLLICAIGAELEAFKEAEHMLREALRAAGLDDGEDDEPTPRLGRSVSMKDSVRRMGSGDGGNSLVELAEDKTQESDNEVPPDLLVAHEEEHDEPPAPHHEARESSEQEDSENEVPPEFLAEHHEDDDEGHDTK